MSASYSESPEIDPGSRGEITLLLEAHHRGDAEAFDRLVPLVYDQLLVIARQQLARWRPGGTLDTVGLAHEAYLRLVDQTLVDFDGRQHFFAVAARAMRLILVDEARARSAKKRGSGERPITLDRIDVGAGAHREVETLLSIDRALRRLAEVDRRIARVFECRFFGGLTAEETATALGLSLRTVQRDWLKAKGLLRRELA
ncbi:MAG: RNA polymerase subunit sigma-70 [Acidobacteria bacterium]|nr:MAG: RNA polymerase subunit sigma-70 [Acidobacteriota bacterium]